MKKMIIIFALIFMCVSVIMAEVSATGYEECGYYDDDPEARPVVEDFISFFTYELLELTYSSDWNTGNNDTPYGVDTYDLVYYCGHGEPWIIEMWGSGSVDLRTAGDNSDGGYGYDMEFLILHSCSVVASPREVGNWWTPWISEPGGIFDGLHMVCGFRTLASKTYDNDIATCMGYYTYYQVNTVLNTWVNSTIIEGDPSPSWDMPSIIFLFHPNDQRYCANTDVYGGSVCRDHDPSAMIFIACWYET